MKLPEQWVTPVPHVNNDRYKTWAMLGALIFCAAMVFFASILGYFIFFEPPWLRYTNIPFPVLTKPIIAGNVIPIRVMRCNDSNKIKHYTVVRSLENLKTGEFILLPSLELNAQPGCIPTDSALHRAPSTAPPGEYRLIGTSEIRGFIMSHIVDWNSDKFTIVEKPPEIAIVPIIVKEVVKEIRTVIVKPPVQKPHTRSLNEP